MKKRINPLGDLELEVMETLWQEGSLTVRELLQKENFDQKAYTTMMTTMDRLFKKGLLCRESQGNAYVYWPKQERSSYWGAVSQEIMHSLMALGGTSTLTAFVDAATEENEDNLERLEKMIQQRRKERGI